MSSNQSEFHPQPGDEYLDNKEVESWLKSKDCPLHFTEDEQLFILADYERYEPLLNLAYKLCHQPNPDIPEACIIADNMRGTIADMKRIEDETPRNK